MAKKLKQTLPKEFSDFYYSCTSEYQHTWTDEDINKFKELLEPCDANARERGGYKRTALHFGGLPFEIIRWLVERGADVNATNTYGTPLFEYAADGNYEVCCYFFEHGADVNIENFAKQTALFYAVIHGWRTNPRVVELLLNQGADPGHVSSIVGDYHTPLLEMLSFGIESVTNPQAEVARILLAAQRKKGPIPEEQWQRAQKYVKSMSREVARNKVQFPDEDCSELDEAMAKYCELFNVEPEPVILPHDGKSPIYLDSKLSHNEQFRYLWDYLVPASGKCLTLQGEVIRTAGRIENEINGNGGANWDAEYDKMLKAFISYLSRGNSLSAKDIQIAKNAAHDIIACKCNCDMAPDILVKCALMWIRYNPDSVPLGEVDYKR